MTTYVVYASSGSPATVNEVAIKAVSYPVKIARIDVSFSTAGFVTAYRYAGATLTGGSTLTPAALRDGAPASTVSAKSGVTTSGTSTIINSFGSSSGSFSYPFDVIIQPGNALRLNHYQLPAGGGSASPVYLFTVYYEEIRLAWSL